jgi:hypothetical protein
MAALGFNPKAFVGGHLTSNPVVRETLGSKMEGMIGTSVWLPQFKFKDGKFPSAQAFADKFNATYGYAPTYHAAFTYVLPWIYQEVLKDADPSDPFNQASLRKKLASFKCEDSIWGPISFDKVGRIVTSNPVVRPSRRAEDHRTGRDGRVRRGLSEARLVRVAAATIETQRRSEGMPVLQWVERTLCRSSYFRRT